VSGRGVLDVDMATLVATVQRTAAQGWRWWIAELEGLVPARLRRRAGGAFPRLWFRDGRLVPERARPLPVGVRVAVIVPTAAILTRTVERPVANDRDLRAMLAIDGDRLMPFAGAAGLVAGRAIGAGSVPGRMQVAVAGLPIAVARDIVAALAPMRVAAARVLAEGSEIDFAPALRDAGLLARSRSAAPPLRAAVGVLLLLNVGAWIWSDQAQVDRLRRLVDAQHPAIAIAQQITARSTAARRIAAEVVRARRRHDPLAVLQAVDAALPEGAWLQHYAWDGSALRISGYRPATADVATLLRRSGRFVAVTARGDDGQNALPGATPFDLTARVRP
jgi:Tfp pilus assembly protein PilN